jgi:hypothetical protein
MSNLSTKKSPNPKSAAAPKKTSATSNQAPRRKTASIAIAAEAPPQIERSKAERVAAANRKAQPEAVQTSPESAQRRVIRNAARRDPALESAIAKLDKYHLLILDDIAYASKDQAETSALFELISARYERRSLLITANQPFAAWGQIFPDQAMTLAAVDRLVHHATIFEMNVESYRRRTAIQRSQAPGRPPTRATVKASSSAPLRDTK